jgi:phosphomevalonate kinase
MDEGMVKSEKKYKSEASEEDKKLDNDATEQTIITNTHKSHSASRRVASNLKGIKQILQKKLDPSDLSP